MTKDRTESLKLHLGDCLDVLRTLPDASVDAVITDPPYGLSFMGRKWDYDVPSVDVWSECLRVLKPGGHLLAFAGTRTQHRMAVRIEDAGFEIRDMIAWVYGSGFPKSLDVSKAIDRAAGVEREVTGQMGKCGMATAAENYEGNEKWSGLLRDNPATTEAQQWVGWGTALKPALETVTFASKPYTAEQERDIILSNLIRLEARLWVLSSASAAEKNSTSNPSEYGEACAIAQWSADEITSTRAALCDPMGTSLFELATNTSLNIVSSWRRTLVESWSDGNTSTIETKSSTTTDLRTLRFSLSQITPESIIKACSLPGGFSANATTAESHFNASLLLLQSIRTLSATEPAISQAQHEHLGAGVKPNLDPCIMARKPLSGTVAENVLRYGTGGLNIDGCRVGENAGWSYPNGRGGSGWHGRDSLSNNLTEPMAATQGRWPANLIHDGSDEVLAWFPEGKGAVSNGRKGVDGVCFGHYRAVEQKPGYGDSGSAARFFYCAKASKRDRDDGLEHVEAVRRSNGNKWTDQDYRVARGERPPSAESGPRRNHHPTVKPTDLMRYLCRLVTPPGGVVLDPFMGSGSTGKAAILEGFRFVGIEREPEYFEIAQRRIDASCRQKFLPLKNDVI